MQKKKQKQCNGNHFLDISSSSWSRDTTWPFLMGIWSAPTFNEWIWVSLIEFDPIQVLWVGSDPIQILSVRSVPIRVLSTAWKPHKVFLEFFQDESLSRPAISVAVHISLRHILIQVWWESVAMVTGYDVICSRWSSHFLKKNSCFLPFLGGKCTKCRQKAAKCLCQILQVQHQFPIFNVFWQFLFFGKISIWQPSWMMSHAPSSAATHSMYLIL